MTDDVVMGAFLYLRSQDEVIRKMAANAHTMEVDEYADKHADFIINRALLARGEARQVCIKLWDYYRLAVG